jgi:hypothetical protein
MTWSPTAHTFPSQHPAQFAGPQAPASGTTHAPPVPAKTHCPPPVHATQSSAPLPHALWLTPSAQAAPAQHPPQIHSHVGQKPPPSGRATHVVQLRQAWPPLPQAAPVVPVVAHVFASTQQPAQVAGPQPGCACTQAPLQTSPAAQATQASPPVPHALAFPGVTQVLSGRQQPSGQIPLAPHGGGKLAPSPTGGPTDASAGGR